MVISCKACHADVTLFPKTLPDPVHAAECPNNPLTAEIARLRARGEALAEAAKVLVDNERAAFIGTDPLVASIRIISNDKVTALRAALRAWEEGR